MIVFEDDLSSAGGVSSSHASRPSAAEASALVTRWMGSILTRRRLEELCGLRTGGARPGQGIDLRSRALEMLRRGDLQVVPRAPRGGGGFSPEDTAAKPPPAEPASSAPPEQKTWIEFQLVGEDDSPVAGVRYRVKVPGGSVREGRTSKSGLIRFDDLDAGKCELTFPDLDQEAWEPA